MISIYGWLAIQGEDNDDEEEDILFCQLKDRVNQLISMLKWNQIKLETQNGMLYILVSLHTNHRTEETEELLRLFQAVEKELPQSYGSLYWVDSEMDPREEGEMLLYSGGGVRKVKDPFGKTRERAD